MTNEEFKLVQDLASLVDGAYDVIELHKVESPYQKLWKANWLAKAKNLIDTVVNIQNGRAN